MPAAVDIVSLDDAKDFLNIQTSANDTELASFITRASQAWVTKVGPVAGSPTFDEWYDGGGPVIALRHTPVQSITTITEAYSDTLAYTLVNDPLDGTGSGGAYGYSLDAQRGILTRRTAGTATAFAPGLRNVHIVYTAGYTTTPDDIKFAVLDLMRDMWRTQRGPGQAPGSGNSDDPTPVYLWPRDAWEVAQSYIVPGIA